MKITDDDYAWPMYVDGKLYHHVTGFLEAMRHRENPLFAEEIRKERSPSIAREMGDDSRQMWADVDLGKRKLTDDEKRRYDATALRTLALRAKFSGSLGDELHRMSDDPDALKTIEQLEFSRTNSRNLARDLGQTRYPPRQTYRSRWDHRQGPGD